MKKIHLGLIGITTLFLTACTVGISSNKSSNDVVSTHSITNLKVTFDFNGGKYDGQEQFSLNDVKPTSYWKYVKAHLTGTITPPDHTTFKGFSFAQDDPNIISDSYVIKDNITVYAQYKAIPEESCTVNWLDGGVSPTTTIATETYFLGDMPEFKGTIPYHEGKTFDHWDNLREIKSTDLGKSVDITAIYVPLKTIYNVTLDYYGDGSEKHTQTVLNGKYAVEPKITKEGYKLDKWEYISGGSGDFDFNIPITKDIEIKAIWVELDPFLQCVTMSVTITKPTTVSFSCDEDDKYIVVWEDDVYDIKNFHNYQSGTHLIKIFGSGGLKSFKLTGGQSCLSEVNISNVESLAESAFRNCSSLTSINIPSSVTSIGDYAFYYCSNLKTVTFEEGSRLTSISNSAFRGCSSLTSITIPSGVTLIGENAFDGCEELQTVIFEEESQLTSIGSSAFQGCSSLTSVTIPSSVTSIGDYAFYYCSNLKTVTFDSESQLESISGGAFHSCSSLTSITIPSGVTSISSYAFGDCSNLQTVTFADESKLALIGVRAFYNCSTLTSINIPSSVTLIDFQAFAGCSNLKSVDLTAYTTDSTIPQFNFDIFEGCSSELKFHVANEEMKGKFVGKGWPESQIVIDE